MSPAARRRGIGSSLLREAVQWATLSGARFLAVETQQVNVPAYRFYERAGFGVVKVRRGAYHEYPEEIQLWLEKQLATTAV